MARRSRTVVLRPAPPGRDRTAPASRSSAGGRGPPPRGGPAMPQLVSTSDAITPAWLTAALREGGVLRTGSVTEVVPTRIGNGQLGAAYSLSITYDGAAEDAPDRFVVKLPAMDRSNREYAASLDCYGREVAFYRELAVEVG